MTKVLFVAQGFYLPLLRIFEPFFLAVVKRNVKNIWNRVFCCRKNKDGEDQFIDLLSLNRNLFTKAELEEEAMRSTSTSLNTRNTTDIDNLLFRSDSDLNDGLNLTDDTRTTMLTDKKTP